MTNPGTLIGISPPEGACRLTFVVLTGDRKREKRESARAGEEAPTVLR